MMTEQPPLPIVLIIWAPAILLLFGLFIMVSDCCSEHECGPMVLRRVGRFLCGTFKRAMTTYVMFDVMVAFLLSALLSVPLLSALLSVPAGPMDGLSLFLLSVIWIFILLPLFFLIFSVYGRYRELSRRFGRREMTDRERALEQAWEQVPVDAVVGAVETAFRKSTPDRTAFKELVHRLLTEYEKMRQGGTRNIFARAFRQLLARDDECGEAFRRAYREWYATYLQDGDQSMASP